MTSPAELEKRKQQAALVPLLLLMTVASGAVDAVSILRLGRVFVANMTGNVAFLGFALAGSRGFSVSASLVALGCFLAGAAIAGRVTTPSPRWTLARVAAAEALLVAVATVVAVAGHGTGARYGITVLLALALGAQNATVRRLAVPDMTTTVLTLTLTGLASDRPVFSGLDSATVRRLSAVASMLVGAAVGAVIVLHTSTGWALGSVAGLLAAVAWSARFVTPHNAETLQ
jgi:uncharacterized membrane protein YoaK (UPF0700 family)